VTEVFFAPSDGVTNEHMKVYVMDIRKERLEVVTNTCKVLTDRVRIYVSRHVQYTMKNDKVSGVGQGAKL